MRMLRLALAGLALLASVDASTARVHSRMYCWDVDSEFPVACEDEDSEDDEGSGAGPRLRALASPET